MTLFGKIKSMSINEMAESAVKHLQIFIMHNGYEMSLLDGTLHDTREKAIAHNKKLLKKKYTEGNNGT